MAPGLELDVPFDRPDSPRDLFRPLAIWFGLAVFLLGAVTLGAALADQSGAVEAFTGPMLLVLGVALVGGGFLMEQSDFFLDPEIEFEGREWYLVVGTSLCLLAFAIAAGAFVVF